jgi:hypothetical protein
MAEDDRDEAADREAILARRRRLIAVALAGITTAATLPACPRACLEPPAPMRDAGSDGGSDDGGP